MENQTAGPDVISDRLEGGISIREPLLRTEQPAAAPEQSPRVAAVLELARTLQWSIGQLRNLHQGIYQDRVSSRAASSQGSPDSPKFVPSSSGTPGRRRAVALSPAAPSYATSPATVSSLSAKKPEKAIDVQGSPIESSSGSKVRIGDASKTEGSRSTSSTNGTASKAQTAGAGAGMPPKILRSSTSFMNPNLDIVQFSSPMYFAEESERRFQVDIMRLGSMRGECKVRYYTQDGTATAGIRYKEASGYVVFKDGEHTKSITLTVIQDDLWSSTLEFKVFLSDPENCELGQYLFVARIKIIDNDLFPSSVFEDAIEEGPDAINEISGWSLFSEYVKLNLNVPGVSWRTGLILLGDQTHTLYLLLTLYLNIYMVDILFKVSPETQSELLIQSGPHGGRIYTAALVGTLFIAPMFLVHLWDIWKVKLDLGGILQEYLQSNMFRKYLNYSSASRLKVPAAHMQVAITSETCEVVEGYMSSLEVVHCVGKLIVLVIFVLRENPNALTPIVLMPLLMCIFSYCRSKSGFDIMEEVAHRTARVVELVNEVVDKYQLIADYQQRPQMCELFVEKSEELCEAKLPVELFKLNNNYFPKWLGPVFTGVYIAFQAHLVLSGALPLGKFLATTRVFTELSEKFTEGYKELMGIQASFVPLRKLTYLLNMETDLKFWMVLNRKRRELSKMARLDVMHTSKPKGIAAAPQNGKSPPDTGEDPSDMPPVYKTDMIEIKLRGLCFAFHGEDYVLRNLSASCPQGKLVAVVGKHGSGKSTLLRLLGHTCFPTDGQVFVPTHLRILHVSQQPQLLSLSAWRNLVFGRPEAIPDRVCKICEDLNMPLTLELMAKDLKRLEAEDERGEQRGASKEDEEADDDDSWQTRLSSTEIAKMHLARALIMNPEVMVLHRPLYHYDPETADQILGILVQHVREKGFHVNPEGASRRRPRTVFFTPNSLQQTEAADIVWNVTDDQDVEEISKEELPDFIRRGLLKGELDD